ncbi:MAG: CBS domain-containing protein [Betaproteobacteria bacterium]|nr:CBS domain-containing protein [Betaproteobacteria bacterium]
MENKFPGSSEDVPAGDGVPEMELTDEDILDAMRHIPGFLDISTEDFRVLYHLAHRHAVGRLFEGTRADRLMRTVQEPLHPQMTLAGAARIIALCGYKGLPVVDAKTSVIGMLTETDFLRRLQADTFLDLMLRMLDDTFEFTHRCHETPVSAAMISPAVTVSGDAGFWEIMRAFHRHAGRSMPVVAGDGHLLGMIFRKDFLAAHHLEDLW